MKREELLSKRTELKTVIDTLENKTYDYKVSRSFNSFGFVSEMGVDELIMANAALNRKMESNAASAVELGLEDFKTDLAERVYGYTGEEWKADFNTRASQINNEAKLQKLQNALTIIEKHLSEDDKFAIDMANVEELLNA